MYFRPKQSSLVSVEIGSSLLIMSSCQTGLDVAKNIIAAQI